MHEQPVVIVSNRGPLSFSLDERSGLVSRRGGGGLITALGPAIAGRGATWIAAALSEADREAASRGVVEAEGFRLRSLVPDPEAYRAYYDVIANGTLWFLHHHLFDLARRPRFDRRWREAWEGYRAVNHAFADAVADEAPEGAVVVVHDYHLTLLAATLVGRRPDLALVHFNHTPFAGPDAMRILPDGVSRELLTGLGAHRACGFHSRRWAAAFDACVREAGVPAASFVSPAPIDADGIRAVAASEACAQAAADLDELVGDRLVIGRVDRIELSKNLVRGFLAFEDLLRTRPEWRERVVFAAFVYPSREGLPEYQAYRQEVEGLIDRINETWATPDWTPIVYDPEDDFPRSVALLRRYDVLLINPVRDGLNLVAKEGPAVNERHGVLALSRESGVWEELGDHALEVNPFDVSGTSDVLHRALSMDRDARAAHAEAVRRAATARSAEEWLADHLAAASRS